VAPVCVAIGFDANESMADEGRFGAIGGTVSVVPGRVCVVLAELLLVRVGGQRKVGGGRECSEVLGCGRFGYPRECVLCTCRALPAPDPRFRSQ
jgi:hypothetical protein